MENVFSTEARIWPSYQHVQNPPGELGAGRVSTDQLQEVAAQLRTEEKQTHTGTAAAPDRIQTPWW